MNDLLFLLSIYAEDREIFVRNMDIPKDHFMSGKGWYCLWCDFVSIEEYINKLNEMIEKDLVCKYTGRMHIKSWEVSTKGKAIINKYFII